MLAVTHLHAALGQAVFIPSCWAAAATRCSVVNWLEWRCAALAAAALVTTIMLAPIGIDMEPVWRGCV
jgi:hypothetical protein